MLLFLAILVLRYTRIYIGTSDHSDIAFYIEASIDKTFCIVITLDVPDINLYNGYVRFGRDLDYLGS